VGYFIVPTRGSTTPLDSMSCISSKCDVAPPAGTRKFRVVVGLKGLRRACVIHTEPANGGLDVRSTTVRSSPRGAVP
jgi:hypothetical protein